jgi:hypothetical protein
MAKPTIQDRIATSFERVADEVERLVTWITSEATMDEASYALSRALCSAVRKMNGEAE